MVFHLLALSRGPYTYYMKAVRWPFPPPVVLTIKEQLLLDFTGTDSHGVHIQPLGFYRWETISKARSKEYWGQMDKSEPKLNWGPTSLIWLSCVPLLLKVQRLKGKKCKPEEGFPTALGNQIKAHYWHKKYFQGKAALWCELKIFHCYIETTTVNPCTLGHKIRSKKIPWGWKVCQVVSKKAL